MQPRVSSQNGRTLRILLLEDSALDAELTTETLSAAGLTVSIEQVAAEADFARAIDSERWDLILADYLLPGFDGLHALDMARERRPEIPFVFVSGALGEEVAVDALKRGAADYVLKDKLGRLPVTVLRALVEAKEREEKREAEEALKQLLDERTSLLHELDHRVKNNLQLLLSLIGIEIRHARQDEVRDVLERMKERLQALGAAHRDLYDGKGSARFDASSFARGLCQELTTAVQDLVITPVFEVEAVEVEASKAAPMALLFNELIVSALAHAYRERHGKLRLAMRIESGKLLFQLSDDVFSPEEKRAAQESASGFILKGLARQLDAVVEWPQDRPEVLVRVLMPVQEVG